jgi:uncharacterized ferritin-like protein (DUF455 family)
MMPRTLAEAAVAILATPEASEKVRLTFAFAEDWRSGAIAEIGACAPPDRPARPPRPELLPPNRMPRRKYGGATGRIALLHALAHIELNAIDLAWDVVARFTSENLPRAFYQDWVTVAGDLKARLAVVPMTLEARGVDTTPPTVEKLRRNGDEASAAVLAVIAAEEEDHVAAGVRWFEFLCRRDGIDPVPLYHEIVRGHFGPLKPPFNVDGRDRAGMAADYYQPLAGPPA